MTSKVDAFSLHNPQQIGIQMVTGHGYDPGPGFEFIQLGFMTLYDYEQFMLHPAPEPLRFKLEGSIGLADLYGGRLLASANFFALYYLHGLASGDFRPYVEAGVGLVYSDFQVDEQGLRLNFNPQAGVGVEWKTSSGHQFFSAVRIYHLSNSELHKDNRGINAATLMFGVAIN